MKRRFLLTCVPALALPAVPASAAMVALTEPECPHVDIGDMVDGREVIDVCEGCQKPLFEGDLVMSYSDGVTLCEPCAPTYADLAAEQEADIARDGFDDWAQWFEGGVADAQEYRDTVLAQVAAGNGAAKMVYRL